MFIYRSDSHALWCPAVVSACANSDVYCTNHSLSVLPYLLAPLVAQKWRLKCCYHSFQLCDLWVREWSIQYHIQFHTQHHWYCTYMEDWGCGWWLSGDRNLASKLNPKSHTTQVTEVPITLTLCAGKVYSAYCSLITDSWKIWSCAPWYSVYCFVGGFWSSIYSPHSTALNNAQQCKMLDHLCSVGGILPA